jgi:serine/threonine-protein kinase
MVISMARETEVPEVIGLGRPDAAQVLESSGLAMGKVTEEVSDSPPGTVIGQGIPGGKVVPVETAVDLTIAKPEMTKVPDLTGASIEEAKRHLKKARLRTGEVTEKTNDEAAGTIIAQRPDAGEEVPVNTAVALVVAKPRMVSVPELRGLEREAALGTVERAGLVVDEVVHEASDKPPGTVIGQEPKARAEVRPGARVALTLSRAETVLVPDLTGLKLKEAERVATQHDLTVERVIRRRSKEPEDTVIGQKPDGGAEVPAGTGMRLTVPIG